MQSTLVTNESNFTHKTRTMEEIIAFDSVHWHMEELSSRVIAKTGIPSDRYHLGKLIMQSFLDAPEFILHIDGTTNQSETFGEALKRTIQCAIGLKKMGVQRGDVIVLLAPNHLHLTIPYYAALYLGAAISPVDCSLTVHELEGMFLITRPKVILCQNEKLKVIQQALKQANLETNIVTFDESGDVCNFTQLINGSDDDEAIEKFKPADFDPEDTLALITFTSGTTGLPKAAALSHKSIAISIRALWLQFQKFPTPTELALVSSPLQWMTASLHFMFSPILRYSRLQSSGEMTTESLWSLIEKYKPTFVALSPTLMTSLVKNRGQRDLSCFKTIMMGGSYVPQELIDDIKRIAPTTAVSCAYGMSEIGGLAFNKLVPVAGSVGCPIGSLQYRLVNVDTNEAISKPNVYGELWLKGPSVMKEYYNNPEATAEVFSKDGWYKSGDIFYRNEYGYFFFTERLKSLLKYRNYQVSPLEIEAVIRQNPDVLDVVVTGIPDPECGDLPVACVVRRPGGTVTAQQIKDTVKETLSDAKQLRGGVVFMQELPTTTSTKVDRRKLTNMVLTLQKE